MSGKPRRVRDSYNLARHGAAQSQSCALGPWDNHCFCHNVKKSGEARGPLADTPRNLAKRDARRMEKIAPSLTALEMPHFTTGPPVREENGRERVAGCSQTDATLFGLIS